jgi:hypothetical protein
MKPTLPSDLVPGKLYIIKTNTNERTVCLRFVRLFTCNGTYASFRDDTQPLDSLSTGFHIEGHTFFEYETITTPLTPDLQVHLKKFL